MGLKLKRGNGADWTSVNPTLEPGEIGIEIDSVPVSFKMGNGVDDWTTLDYFGGAISGSAGGDLTGTYPNPTIASNAVTTAKINALAVTAAKIAANTITAGQIAASTITDNEIASANKDGASGTASLRTLGTSSVQAAAGNDSRLTNQRVPTDASVTGGPAGTGVKIAASTITDDNVATANKDGTSGTPSLRTLGTSGSQAAAGNDSRLSDSRAPNGAAGGDLSGTYPNPTVTGLSGKATDSLVVHLAGTETVTGDKNFTGALTHSSNAVVDTTDSRLTDSRAPNGAAGGSLTGTYPNPTITALAVDTAQLAGLAVTTAKLASNSVTAAKITAGVIDDTHIATGNKDGTAATPSMRTLGTSSIQAAPGNDSRLDFKVRAVVTTNINTTTGMAVGTVFDGVTVASADRVLLTGQSTASQNGPYVIPPSGSAGARASDAVVANTIWSVSEGTVNADTRWWVTTNNPITLGSTSLTIAQIPGGAGSVAWGAITGTLSSQTDLNTALTGKAATANNLSDLADATTARWNIKVPIQTRCLVVSVVNQTLSGLPTVDGVTLVANNRILLVGQSTGSENGPWQVQSGAWTRPADFPSGGVVQAYVAPVAGGTSYSGSLWEMTHTGNLTIDSGSQTWVQSNSTTPQTLTNKTLTSPVVNTPTGIVKGDVGLGNVDNTSDATKNSASATLTNKTLTSPVINTPTGIVKGDVGLGNVDNTSDATKNAASVTLTNKTLDDTNTATFKDSGFTIENASDTTRKIVFDNGFVGTGQTRTVSFPNANITVVGLTTTQTFTNKTLTSPVINTPTGIVKGDVGLGNVDNTSDATKNSASATLTNKTLTSPVINTPTGIVKGDVGLGNVDNTSNATERAATATLTNKDLTSGTNTFPSFPESQITNLVTDLAGKQPLDADLTTLAGLSATTDNMIVSVGSAWASRTPTQVKVTLAITESDVANLVTDLAAKAPLASPIFTGNPEAPDPSTTQGLATKNYVDTHPADSFLPRVRLVATINVVIATALEAGDAIDTVTLAAGDRVLLTGQTTASENGPYIASASGAASRAPDVITANSMWVVSEGIAAHQNTIWQVTTDNPISVGSTSIAIAQFAPADGGAATPSLRTLGTGSAQALAGNSRLDDLGTPVGDVSMASHKITNVTDPVSAQDAATRNFVLTRKVTDLTAPTSDFSMNTHKITSVTDPGAAQDAATQNYVLTRKVTDLTAPTSDFSMNSHKITSVTDPTSAQDVGTKNYIDNRLFVANMGATTASVNGSGGTGDQTMWTPSNVAAANLSAGVTMFRIRYGGNFDNTTTSGIINSKVKINGTTIATIPIAVSQTGAATVTTWWIDFDTYIDITGSGGAATATGYAVQITAAGGARNTIPVLGTTSVNLTAGCQFTVIGQFATGNAGNILRVFRASIAQVS